MDALLITEELFLLTHDDETGKADNLVAGAVAFAGALLLDLAEQGLVQADGKKLVPVGSTATHPLLAEAAAELAASKKPRDARHWVDRLPRVLKPFEDKIGTSLVERGVLRREDGKALGLFKYTKWPERDPEPERRLRAGLADVLGRGAQPTPRQELLIPLLATMGYVPKLVAKDERKAAKARAKEITDAAKDGSLVSSAVSQSVAATQSAVLAAVMTPMIAASVNN